MDLFGLFLFLHLFGAMAGIGPTFVFGRISRRGAGTDHSLFATRVVRLLTSTTAIPLSALVLMSGVGLMVERGYALFDRMWLLISIILFAGSFTYSVTVQNPTLARIIDSTKEGKQPTEEEAAEIARLRTRIRRGGIYLRSTATVILALMIFKPF